MDEKMRDCTRGLESLYFDLNRTGEALEISENSRGQSLETLLSRKSRRLPALRLSQNISLVDMQLLAKRQEATIVVYSKLSETKLLVFVVSEHMEGPQPFSETILRRAMHPGFIRYLRNQYEKPSILRRLYDELILPIERAIEGSKSLIVIPDGDLFRVPFAALIDRQGRHLIENFVIRTSTSLGAIIELEQHENNLAGGERRAESAVIVGDPRRNLPGAVRESTYAAQAMQDNEIDVLLLQHENAAKARLLEAMASSDYIHLSAHGGDDFVELANPNSYLTSFDVDVGSLERARLVVLSACNTWKGKIRADGVFGLVRAIAAAGAPAIIATLWAVEDDDTLMRRFYDKFLSNENLTAAEAFRDAVVSLIRAGAETTAWSPFVLLYDAKPKMK